jgi:hypothetical protein
MTKNLDLPAPTPEEANPYACTDTPNSIAGLIAELEALREPDRFLDARIAAIFWPDFRVSKEGREDVLLSEVIDEIAAGNPELLGILHRIPRFTASFDDALTLLENVPFDFFRYPDGLCQAVAGAYPIIWSGDGSWPAVAMVVAALRKKEGA